MQDSDASRTSGHSIDERRRSAALHSYDALDTPREEEFDDLARMASEVCGTPIAVVNLVDTGRQFFKAEVGLGVRETPLETSFCGHAILEEDLMVVPDATKDPRFECNPLITGEPGLRFYAGAVLKTPEGLTIGTMCVLDFKPRNLDDHQLRTLRLLARQAMTQLELRRSLSNARAAEVRHREVLDSAVDYAIISLDLDGNVTGWNRGAGNVLGWSEAEMIGKPADIIFNAVDRTVGIPDQEMKSAREEGRGADERWHVRKDGSRFFALGEMMPLRDQQERHVGYVKILRDRTEERRRAQRLTIIGQISEALLTADDPAAALRPILESSADALGFDQSYAYEVETDRDTLCLRQSVGVDEETRMALETVSIDVPICGIVAKNGEPLVLSRIQASQDDRFALARQSGLDAYAGFPIRIRDAVVGVISFATRDTSAFDEESLSFFETVARFVSVSRERLNREASLRDAEERARLAQEAGRIGTFEVDVASGRMSVSAELCRTLGLPVATDLMAATMEGLVLEEDAGLRSSEDTRRDGSAAPEVEYRIRRADDGTVRWIARRAEFVRDELGQVRSMFGTVQDVTDRKRAETHQKALLDLAVRLRGAETTAEVSATASECLGRTLQASRVGYARIDLKSDLLAVERDWTADGTATMQGSFGLAAFRQTVALVSSGETVVVADIGAAAFLTEDEPSYRRMGTRAQIMVPLVDRGALVGVLFVHQVGTRHWNRDEVEFAKAVADQAYAAFGRVRAEGEQRVLNLELSHRMKNTLAMVQAIATQTLRGVTERDAVEAFTKRIHALSTAHLVLVERNWASAGMRETATAVLGTFETSGHFSVSGPDVEIGPRSTLSLSLLLHELSTNAIKYGALSDPNGRVAVSWRLEGDGQDRELRFEWRESGGPEVAAPSSKGFGSRLIRMGLTGTGGVELHYDPSGFSATMNAPLSQLQQS